MEFTEIMMISRTTTSCGTSLAADSNKPAAFTLIEMIIVMMIISAMVTIILPYAAAGSDSRQISRQCLNITQLLRYALTLAHDTKRPTRIVINPTTKSYTLEIASGIDAHDFVPADNITAAPQYLGQNIYILDIDGFSIEQNRYYLLFDPAKPWPIATISLATKDVAKTINITGNRIEIDSSAF